MINLVGGLPVHPLIVHVAVIMLPLSALLAIGMVVWPAARNKWVWGIASGFGVVGAVAAWIAKWSGEQLTLLVGYPGQHAELGDITVWIASIFAVSLIAWGFLFRDTKVKPQVKTAGSFIVIALSAAVTVSIVLTGHSGAAATWENKIPKEVVSVESPVAEDADIEPQPPEGTTPIPEPTEIPEPEVATVVLDADLVAEFFATREYCWTIVNGEIYDLSSFVDDHRGGPGNILELCGTDGSELFARQHEGQRSPAVTLDKFKVGDLGTEVPFDSISGPEELKLAFSG